MSTTTSPPTNTERTAHVSDHLHETASADRVFGAPIERDGATVVPVATVRSATARGRVRRRRRRNVGHGELPPG